LPEDLLKYVIAHEIAHAFIKTHTKRFWKVVESIHPNYKEAQNILKQIYSNKETWEFKPYIE